MNPNDRDLGSPISQRGEASPLIALVEDASDQAALVAALIESAGFTVQHFANVASFEQGYVAHSPAAVVLDWSLPDGSGLDVLRRLRARGETGLPVLMLTARAEESDVAAALDAGADDFLSKPARRLELSARLRALLRRRHAPAESPDTAPFRFDANRRQVLRGDLAVVLTGREFELAMYLFGRPGSLISRRELETAVLGLDARVTSRALDTHMSRIRRKLELDERHGWKLEAVYQRGYRLSRV